ncbi:hypothetical protein DH2020_008441 [Rehmannia glutinosa]|uniref:Uncharacterized protein n=1 Tax=Rehmannia glutinosa TaxID=99300 RepID=A0ABR0U1P9_REHGL
MINTERNGNGVGNGGTAAAIPAHDKQLPSAPKKTALRDVQNENVGSVHKQQESLLPGGGRPSVDTIKAYNGTNENVMNARRRFELELGRGRLQSNIEKSSDYSELKNSGQLRDNNNLTATMTFSSNGPSIPSSFGKHGNSTLAVKVSPELPRTVDYKVTGDQLRTERFIRLQKFLKQCDEANQREYTQMLLHLSPSELSKHAVELEKRAIQLTIEEGNEMQRMKALNILAKSSPAKKLIQSTQLLQSNKR